MTIQYFTIVIWFKAKLFDYNVSLDVILWIIFALKINLAFEQLYEKCIIGQHMNTMCKM